MTGRWKEHALARNDGLLVAGFAIGFGAVTVVGGVDVSR